MAGRKVFTSGEILTSADVNSFLMNQVVAVFADSTARSSAIPSPSEGMVTYLKDTNQVQAFTGSAFTPLGTILQVVSTTKTDTFASSSTSYVDVTGLSASITPSATSSKIMATVTINSGRDGGLLAFQLLRDSTAIALGDTAGNRTRASAAVFAGDSAITVQIITSSVGFLDSPSTTSALTYKVQGRTSSNTFVINRTGADSATATFPRTVSTITLMEVAG